MIYCWIKNQIGNWTSFMESQIRYEIAQSKNDILKGIHIPKNIQLLPEKYLRSSRPEFFFLLELIILIFLAFAFYHWFSFFSYLANFAPESSSHNWSIDDVPFDQLEKVQMIRDGWMKWYEYFYKQDPYSDKNQGTYFVELATLIRPMLADLMIYVFFPMACGYIVWFTVKYYEYVIAAVWGYFIMMYSFMTKKIECQLGKKWYISFVTGWKKCNPSFSKYLYDWYVRFIQRPLRQNQVNYARAFEQLRVFKGGMSLHVIWNGIIQAFWNLVKTILNIFKNIFDKIHNFFKTLGNLIHLIWTFILSLFGVKFNSESNQGGECECNPESENFNDASTCKDSLFIDIILVYFLLYPIWKYIPVNELSNYIQNFIQNVSVKFNADAHQVKTIFAMTTAILLYAFDVFIYS